MEYSPLQHIIESLYLNNAPEVYVAAFTIYIDDSGTAPTQDVAVAAGWIAKMPTWGFFHREWEKVRNIESDKFKCMHMTYFVDGRGRDNEFKGWSLDKKLRVSSRLQRIIKKRALKGFSMGVFKKDFDETVPPVLKTQGFENHYTYSMRCVLGMIDMWRQEQKLDDTTIEYVFDFMNKHDPRRQEIERVFELAKGSPESFKRYGIDGGGDSLSFRDSCKVTPLQAADMLAWLTYRVTVDEFESKNTNPITKQCFDDFYQHRKGTFLEGGYQNKTHLEEWVKSKGFEPLTRQTSI